MKRRHLLASALLLFGLAPVRAQALDLTPIPGFREQEGVKIPVVRFEDGDRKITYQPPPEWRASGGGDTLHLYAPGEGQGWMKIICVDRTPDLAAADPSPEALQAAARRFLPKGAEEIALVRQVPSPFTLEARPSTEFVFSYLLFSSRDLASVSVVERNEKQLLIVLISAGSEKFNSIHDEAIASLFSWRIGR